MTHDAVLAPTAGTHAERYRRAESALWEHYGLRPTTRTIQLDQPRLRLRIQEVGRGMPVLLVHGTVGAGGWPSLIEAMGTGYRFILLDRPGWVGSEPLDFSAHPYRNVAADILAGGP